jgi:hypothetical protein
MSMLSLLAEVFDPSKGYSADPITAIAVMEPSKQVKPDKSTAAAPIEPSPETSAILHVDGVEIVYCDGRDQAEAMIWEVIADAGGRPVALDIETAPIRSERERLAALTEERAGVHAKLLAAGRALREAKKAAAKGEPHDDIAALEDDAVKAVAKQEKHLTAQVEYAERAGLDPHRSRIRLVQVYGGKSRARSSTCSRPANTPSSLCRAQKRLSIMRRSSSPISGISASIWARFTTPSKRRSSRSAYTNAISPRR